MGQSLSQLYVHLTFGTKYREPLINQTDEERLLLLANRLWSFLGEQQGSGDRQEVHQQPKATSQNQVVCGGIGASLQGRRCHRIRSGILLEVGRSLHQAESLRAPSEGLF